MVGGFIVRRERYNLSSLGPETLNMMLSIKLWIGIRWLGSTSVRGRTIGDSSVHSFATDDISILRDF